MCGSESGVGVGVRLGKVVLGWMKGLNDGQDFM